MWYISGLEALQAITSTIFACALFSTASPSNTNIRDGEELRFQSGAARGRASSLEPCYTTVRPDMWPS